MGTFKHAMPALSVRLYKTISRTTVDGQKAVSQRYAGKEEFIDLTPYLGDGSSVRTSKSVREPAGGFSVTFMDKASATLLGKLESIYGLVEPMDGIEIRMWGGIGRRPNPLPIIMRGFITTIQRGQAMGDNGKPMRTVTITGQDYGKIWQMYQVIYLQAYSEGKSLLTTYGLWELFGLKAQNAMPAADLVKNAIEKIINPFLKEMLPDNWSNAMPRMIMTDDITVKRGKVNNSYQNAQGSIYQILISNTDVPTWNELYTEDREDGVHCVFRPIPALKLTPGENSRDHRIQSDAPEPIFCEIEDSDIQSQTVSRTDASVANFYWVTNTRYDLIDDMQRKMQSIQSTDKRVNFSDYPNADRKYYGVRPMYAATQMTDNSVTNMLSGQSKDDIEKNRTATLSWIDQRRLELVEMNKDNVVLESGSARVKGGQMRPDGKEAMKAGDYARFLMGNMVWDAYCVQIEHEFIVYGGYTSTIVFERGEGFATRVAQQPSPWLTEIASRT